MKEPINARDTATHFLFVMCWFKKTEARRIIKIVESWLYIAALPARVYLNPARQNITDKNVPKNATAS